VACLAACDLCHTWDNRALFSFSHGAVNIIGLSSWPRCRSAVLWWTPKANRRGRGVLSDGWRSFQVDRGSIVLLVCIQKIVWSLRRWLFGAMERLRVWGGRDSGSSCVACGVASPTVPGTWETSPLNPGEILRLIRPTEMRSTSRLIAVECRVRVPTHYVIWGMSFLLTAVYFSTPRDLSRDLSRFCLCLLQNPHLPTSFLHWLLRRQGYPLVAQVFRPFHLWSQLFMLHLTILGFRVPYLILQTLHISTPLSIHGKRVYYNV
jgi:hypothetical protein